MKLLTSLNTILQDIIFSKTKIAMLFGNLKWLSQPEEKVDGLNSTDDGESSQEAHRAPNQTQLGLKLDLLVSLNVVEGRSVKVDLNQLKGGLELFS